jgi:hypothetical protein
MEKSPLKQKIPKTTKVKRSGDKEKIYEAGELPSFTVTYSKKDEEKGLVGKGGQPGQWTHHPPLNMEGTVQRAYDPNYDVIKGDVSPVGQYRDLTGGSQRRVKRSGKKGKIKAAIHKITHRKQYGKFKNTCRKGKPCPAYGN